ncbi:MAG: hypothetical protein PHC75_10565 [Burkholderiales bacterium]|nr:hypothetical protein [Burkholderiales bacterium]
MVNATGWNELMDANLVGAAYTMFDTAFGSMGIVVVILFFLYQFMLYMKTQNLVLCFIMGVIFTSLYATSLLVEQVSVGLMFVLLVFELAAIMYMWFHSSSK